MLAALASFPGYASAKEVHEKLVRDGAPTGLATVYRQLAKLHEAGRIELDLEQREVEKYRLCTTQGHHHHLECTECGRHEEIVSGDLEFRLRQVASRLGFTLTDHVIALRGTCAHCAGHS